MDSPVKIPYQSFIKINRNSEVSIYMQISNQLINAIQRGFLPFGTKLPGTRMLSEMLNVHRNTIVSVYEELFSQGWVESLPNKGTFIIGKDQYQFLNRKIQKNSARKLSEINRIYLQNIQYFR
jgi:GntR family transcriptional regulator/MocR family aminotransferase